MRKKLLEIICLYQSSFISFFLKLIRSPFLALQIVAYLNSDELGYWYTYQAIGGYIVLCEFGISKLISIYTSSFIVEFRSTSFSNKIELFRIHSSRVVLSIIFYLIIYLISIFILFFFSFLFFDKWGMNILIPFLFYLFGSALSLFYNFYINLLYGVGLIKKRNHLENWYGLISFILILFFLYFGFKLYSLGLALLMSNIFIYLFHYNYIKYWSNRIKKYYSLIYFKKILLSLDNIHWKYFTTNIISLYITSSLTIFVMKFFNPILAGRIGLTLFILNSITGISNVFFYTRYPEILFLIQQNKLIELKKITKYLLTSMLTVFLLCVIFLIILIKLLTYYNINFIKNLLSIQDIIFISIVNFCLIIIGLLAQIVRGYKVEPYWKLSIIQVFTSTFLYFISYHFNNIHYYFILDSFLHIFILLPLSIYFGKFYILKIFKSNSTFVK